MKLKCHLTRTKCPPYSHDGKFIPNNTTIKGLLPDLRRCANCITYDSPSLPAFRDDLLQIASITLIQKGPAYNPTHESGASFGTYIRPRICGSLIYAKRRELKHLSRETPESYMVSETTGLSDVNDHKDIDIIHNFPDANAENFVDELVWKVSVANFEKVLPQLQKALTNREQQVFTYIREDRPNCEIAKLMQLSPPRISQLVRNVEQKLREACQRFKLIE